MASSTTPYAQRYVHVGAARPRLTDRCPLLRRQRAAQLRRDPASGGRSTTGQSHGGTRAPGGRSTTGHVKSALVHQRAAPARGGLRPGASASRCSQAVARARAVVVDWPAARPQPAAPRAPRPTPPRARAAERLRCRFQLTARCASAHSSSCVSSALFVRQFTARRGKPGARR